MVNGGNANESASDSQILKAKGYMDKSYNSTEMYFKWWYALGDVEMGWHEAGIDCDAHLFMKNDYYINGEKMTREEALANIGA